jgi:hypothetical protein
VQQQNLTDQTLLMAPWSIPRRHAFCHTWKMSSKRTNSSVPEYLRMYMAIVSPYFVSPPDVRRVHLPRVFDGVLI